MATQQAGLFSLPTPVILDQTVTAQAGVETTLVNETSSIAPSPPSPPSGLIGFVEMDC